MNTFNYGKKSYEFELKRESRKTLSLTVKPNLRIILKSPINANEEQIKSFLKRKWSWLEKQLNYFKKHQKLKSEKEYISGESIWYLGRQYKLIVKSYKNDLITLDKRNLYIFTTKPTSESINNRYLLQSWFRKQRRKVFNERFEGMKKRFDYKRFPRMIIRDMDKRWGSFINKEKIILNPTLIHASIDCIDYVIVHELCHMKYKNHSKYFFEYLSEKYPRWEEVKEKLEMSTIF